ncbi:MAG: CC0125/CC1285 family lipoprotein [Solimonas sp.]
MNKLSLAPQSTTWAILAAAALLAGCASVTPYQPSQKGFGYSEQMIEANRYRVIFAGSSATPRQTVENYLLYHAAEITLNSGNDYFVVASSGTSAKDGSGPTLGLGIGGFGFGGHSGVGLGVGTETPTSKGAEYTAQAEILVYKGKKPADDPKAFDAREVKTNLEAGVVRPAAK